MELSKFQVGQPILIQKPGTENFRLYFPTKNNGVNAIGGSIECNDTWTKPFKLNSNDHSVMVRTEKGLEEFNVVV